MVATGIGTKQATAGNPEELIVEARTILGELVDVVSPMRRFTLKMPRAECSVHSVENLGNGMHKITYSACNVGQHQLHVMYNGIPIANSPLMVDVAPAVISPPHCVASGPGIEVARYGHPTSFVVHMCDEYENDLAASSADDVQVQFHFQGQTQLPTSSELLDDGSCMVTYTIWSAAPEFLASVSVNGKSIRGSPFLIPIAHAVAHQSKCSGSGLELAVCGEEATFRVMPFTALNEVVDIAQGHLHVAFGESSEILARVKRIDHGCYEVAYLPIASDGACQIFVRLRENSSEHECGFTLNHVQGSPFSVPVVAGAAHAPNCTGWRHKKPIGLEYSKWSANRLLYTEYVVSGNTNFAEVHLFDKNNNPLVRGGDKVDVALYDIHSGEPDGQLELVSHPSNARHLDGAVSVEDLLNGTYNVNFSVSGTQLCQLAIRVHGEDIRGSPFVLRVLSADPLKSAVAGPAVLQGFVGEELHALIELYTDTNEAVGVQSLDEIVVDIRGPIREAFPEGLPASEPEAVYGAKVRRCHYCAQRSIPFSPAAKRNASPARRCICRL